MPAAAVRTIPRVLLPPRQNLPIRKKDDVAIDASLVDDMVKNDPDIKGQTIYWLADYDINPKNNQDRSVALSLFEDKYGAKVEYVSCTSDTKFDTLASRILGGDPVDMFPYEWDAVPNGVTKEQYQPLDDYLVLATTSGPVCQTLLKCSSIRTSIM